MTRRRRREGEQHRGTVLDRALVAQEAGEEPHEAHLTMIVRLRTGTVAQSVLGAFRRRNHVRCRPAPVLGVEKVSETARTTWTRTSPGERRPRLEGSLGHLLRAQAG